VEHTHQLEAAHARATPELSTLRERHTGLEVLREENRALERRAASADELSETVVLLEGGVEAVCAEREAWYISYQFCYILVANFYGTIRARNAVPETPSATPVSITQSLSALRLEHAHLLEEHAADSAALRQREAELADIQAREVNAHETVDALLQATDAVEERATRAERTATFSQRGVGFLQALNVSLSLDHLISLYLYPLGC
jgi:mitotic spindle assembly checkpoint protein MAD1